MATKPRLFSLFVSRLVAAARRSARCAPVVAAAIVALAQAAVMPATAADEGAVQQTGRVPRKHLKALEPRLSALTGGVLIDGTGAPPLPDAVVVVRDDRIAAAGRRDEVTVPAGAAVTDVRGATIMPGVFNAHVHSGYREEQLRAWAHSGVTTVRDLGGPALFGLVGMQNKRVELARVVAAGLFVTVPGGYPIVPWGSTNVVTVRSAEEARSAVGGLIDQGAEIVKIALESGADFGRSIPTLSPQEAFAVVEATHARGIPVSAHVTTSPDVPRALDAGVDDIAHMVVDYPSSELLARVVRQGVIWVPTLELWRVVGYGHEPRAVANLQRFLQAGGTVALGTDFDGYNAPFETGMPLIEMELMRQAGMSPMQSIVAATRNAARVSNLEAELGTVQAGKLADLIVVQGDPLLDVHAMAQVRLVMRSGAVIRNDGFD
jgi:imidazolonepropionase-like amidohydrolase